MIRSYVQRTRILSLVLPLAALVLPGVARADSFVASPQDYPTPAAYAQAYAAAAAEGPALADKVFNPNAYQCGDYCKTHLVMTAIERRVVSDGTVHSDGHNADKNGP